MKLSLMLALLSLITRMFGQSIYCDEINQQISSMGTFPFGVSSGDPRTHSFIALTQLNPCKIMNGNIVQCEVSKDPNFLQLVAQEYQIPLADNGYSVKFAIGSLAEAQIYYYRFIYGNDTSRVGRAKTCCEDCNTISFAVVSCSNYEWGYFNAYGRIARMENIDFVVHLGDYIYEHGPGVYGNKELPRKHLPRKEIVLLEDYRSRYAQYRLDPNLQDLHAAYSFITVWDDHEIANDAYKDGAQNHQAEEGEWDERKIRHVKFISNGFPLPKTRISPFNASLFLANWPPYIYWMNAWKHAPNREKETITPTERCWAILNERGFQTKF